MWSERRWRSLSATKHLPPGDSTICRLAVIYSLVGALDMKQFLSGWFKDAPFEQLRMENVKDFFAYGLWCVPDCAESPSPHFPKRLYQPVQVNCFSCFEMLLMRDFARVWTIATLASQWQSGLRPCALALHDSRSQWLCWAGTNQEGR
jgi:hypothetical protein